MRYWRSSFLYQFFFLYDFQKTTIYYTQPDCCEKLFNDRLSSRKKTHHTQDKSFSLIQNCKIWRFFLFRFVVITPFRSGLVDIKAIRSLLLFYPLHKSPIVAMREKPKATQKKGRNLHRARDQVGLPVLVGGFIYILLVQSGLKRKLHRGCKLPRFVEKAAAY